MSVSLSQNLRNSALNYPNHRACVFLNESVTYAELDHLVDSFASRLSSQGIGKGDTVALVLGNSIEYVVAYYGVLRVGATVVPVNPIYTSREISYILRDSQAKGVIANASLTTVLTPLQQELENIELLIYTDAEGSKSALNEFVQSQVESYESPEVDEEDTAVVLYTSGTTGAPKGAMLSHKNLASNAEVVRDIFIMKPDDRMITVLPIFHVFCMTVCMNAPIACGATMLVHAKFSPSEVIRTIREEQATIFAGVPTMFNFMYQLPEPTADDFSSMRLCVSGGAPIPVELLHKFEERYKVLILEGYGLSESSPVACFNPLRGTRKAGSIGVPIPGVRMKVVDVQGNEVPTGDMGELLIQGPNVMKGYLGMEEQTARALKDGWLYTGDIAKVDDDGYFYIVDRKKDMILVGGYNVYPREVEEVLYQHPSVVEAAVIGVPDQDYGEIVKAYIVLKDNEQTVEDMMHFCQTRLAKYKVPKRIELMDELPKNSTGKILRRELRNVSTVH